MISIKQLHYALAIEKTLHFKKAAQLCNVSQSALSTAINELEKQLDVTIFERNNKQVLVTNSGQLILKCLYDSTSTLAIFAEWDFCITYR